MEASTGFDGRLTGFVGATVPNLALFFEFLSTLPYLGVYLGYVFGHTCTKVVFTSK